MSQNTLYSQYMKKIKTLGMMIKTLCFDPSELSVTEAAKILKIARPNLSLLINGKGGVSPAMALRLEAVFNTDARQWLLLQLEYDLTLARKKKLNLKCVSKKKIKIPKMTNG